MFPPMDGYEEQPQEWKDEMDATLMHLVDIGAVSFSWDDKIEEFVFWMTDEQKDMHDLYHPG